MKIRKNVVAWMGMIFCLLVAGVILASPANNLFALLPAALFVPFLVTLCKAERKRKEEEEEETPKKKINWPLTIAWTLVVLAAISSIVIGILFGWMFLLPLAIMFGALIWLADLLKWHSAWSALFVAVIIIAIILLGVYAIVNDRNTVTNGGDLYVDNLIVNNDATINGDLMVEDDVLVNGDVAVNNDVVINQGDVNVEQGDVNVEQGDVNVNQGDVNVEQGDVNVEQGDVNVNQGDVNVEQGDVNVNQGDVNVEQGDLNVGGDANVQGDLNVGGDVNENVEPPATEPPATETPATEPPATEPPATEPPATEPPATEPPATEPPATEPPATEPPATEPPATEPPATEPVVTPSFTLVDSGEDWWEVKFEGMCSSDIVLDNATKGSIEWLSENTLKVVKTCEGTCYFSLTDNASGEVIYLF